MGGGGGRGNLGNARKKSFFMCGLPLVRAPLRSPEGHQVQQEGFRSDTNRCSPPSNLFWIYSDYKAKCHFMKYQFLFGPQSIFSFLVCSQFPSIKTLWLILYVLRWWYEQCSLIYWAKWFSMIDRCVLIESHEEQNSKAPSTWISPSLSWLFLHLLYFCKLLFSGQMMVLLKNDVVLLGK